MADAYAAMERGLREIHRLALDGKLDTPEADAIRDATDAPFYALTDDERRRIGELSESLYDSQPERETA